MRRKQRQALELQLKALADAASLKAAKEIGQEIPRFSGCEVTIERRPTRAWRVGIFKPGRRLSRKEEALAGDIVHKALAPALALLYGEEEATESAPLSGQTI